MFLTVKMKEKIPLLPENGDVQLVPAVLEYGVWPFRKKEEGFGIFIYLPHWEVIDRFYWEPLFFSVEKSHAEEELNDINKHRTHQKELGVILNNKPRNFVAKHMYDVNKAVIMIDKKKLDKNGYMKHPKRIIAELTIKDNEDVN